MKYSRKWLTLISGILVNLPLIGIASTSSLTINNTIPNIELSIITDLICHGFPLTHDFRYTTSLSENPIRKDQGEVIASWQNCWLVSKEYYEMRKETDHSKLYVTLK